MALRLFLQVRWLVLGLLLVPYAPVLYGAVRFASEHLVPVLADHLAATAALVLLTACFAGGLGTILGFAVVFMGPRLQQIALWAIAAGVLLPIEFHGMVWLAWLGTGTPAGLRAGKGGIHAGIAWVLEASGLGLPTAQQQVLATLLAATIVHGLWGAGLVALGTTAAATRVPQELLDGAALETNSPWRSLRHVVLPTIWPATLGLLLVAASSALTEVAVVDLLQYRTLADDVYVAFQLEANPDRAFATALPLIGLAILLAGALLYLARCGVMDLILVPQRSRIHGSLSFTTRIAMGLIVVLGTAAISLAPYAGIVLRPLTAGSVQAAEGNGTGFVSAFDPIMATASVVHRELAVSLMAGSLAAALATLVGFGMVYGTGSPTSLLCLVAIAAVLGATPGPVLGVGVNACAMWFGSPIYDSYVPLLWGMTLRCLPVCLVVACAWRVRLDPNLVDMARLDGGNPLVAVWHIWWPLSRTHAMISLTLGLLVTLGDVGVAVITAPPGIPPLPVRVFSLLHYGLDEYVAGIAFWLVSTIAAVAGLLFLVTHRKTSE